MTKLVKLIKMLWKPDNNPTVNSKCVVFRDQNKTFKKMYNRIEHFHFSYNSFIEKVARGSWKGCFLVLEWLCAHYCENETCSKMWSKKQSIYRVKKIWYGGFYKTIKQFEKLLITTSETSLSLTASEVKSYRKLAWILKFLHDIHNHHILLCQHVLLNLLYEYFCF